MHQLLNKNQFSINENKDIPKVLIVDDKDENLYTLERVLSKIDVDVVKAKSGNDALIAILNHDFAVAILDVQMPEMDGYELAEYIRSEEKSKFLPIIFLSAVFYDDFHVNKGYESGAVDFITKPFNTTILLSKVKVFIELYKNKVEQKKMNKRLQDEIYERKLAEQQIKKYLDRLHDLNATKDKFFSIVAHDLKNPFNTLIGFAEVLEEHHRQLPVEKLETIINRILQAARRGYNLLENLLEWSRSQTGRIECNPIVFDTETLVNENVLLLQTQAEKKNISLKSNIKKKSTIYADVNMLRTVIRNLISNALKFTPQGGNVILSFNKIDDEKAEILIEDNGIGISEDNQKKLFKIDQSFSTPGTEKEYGTGLGLILCKEFIEKNKGEMTVDSAIGKGSVFRIVLPHKN